MNLFFDTSALVKLFSVEEGSEAVKKIITNPENNINVLDLALVELYSAVQRKCRNNQIPEENLVKIQSAIEKQMSYFNTIPIGGDIMVIYPYCRGSLIYLNLKCFKYFA